MSPRPDIAAVLDPGEELLWHGHPLPGRRVPLRANIIASLLFGATMILALVSWYIAIFWGHIPVWHRTVFWLLALAALLTFFGLRVTVLDLRRARARDRRTAYGITGKRALALAGSYRSEVPLGPGVTVTRFGDTVTIAGETTRLRFERLDDASAARDILMAQIEGDA